MSETIMDLKPCRKAIVEMRRNKETGEFYYIVLDTGLYYGVPIFEKNRTYTDIEFTLVRCELNNIAGGFASRRWIITKLEGWNR